MRENFETLADDEIAPLLQRLTAEEVDEPVVTTVRDVAEATGLSEEEVRAALREMRRARLSEELRILEEPLYRVERPGHADSDPYARYLARERTLNTILDRPATIPKPFAQPAPTPRENWMDYLILVPLLAAVGYFLVHAVIAIGRS